MDLNRVVYVGTYVETPAPGRRPKRLLDLECDFCGAPFEKAFSANLVTQLEHFCSRKCSQAAHQHLRLAMAAKPESVAKRKVTTKKRFGVESMFKLDRVHQLANTPEKCRQRHETMKRNGSYFNSKSEHSFHNLLMELFGEENVQRQVVVNKWPIDFYVKTIDSFVQFDGEYWHGLDRPLVEIMQFKTPRDKTILRKYQIDREQDNWFRDHDLRLVRITDKQFERGQLMELAHD